ncbi:MAG: AIDA repeat-containing protein, partial [Acidaminococcaceae bacterium]|nr:AIDA repeat-containing protein [Acidaminococcaceae bacterium]
MSRKKKLQKKIAVAVSVVNLLNTGAPLVLPYVNVAGQMPAAGGQIVQFADTAQSVLYGTAHAENYTIPPNSTVAVMNADDTMNVNSGGTGTVTTMNGGVQNVNSGGTGTVVTMSGGKQIINNGGTGTVSSMNGGEQSVSSGGTGTVSSLQSGGKQIVYNGGMAISTTIDNGGTQSVLSGGTATDTTLKNKGKQIVSSGGVASGGTFSGVNTNTRGYQEVFEGGTVVGAIFSAFGNQTVTGGMARDTTVCGETIVSGGSTVTVGGIQAITNNGVSLNATIKSGGTQSATEGGILAGTQTIEAGASASGGTLKEITVDGKTFKGVQNVNSGGTANNITVTGGGTQFVLSGGTANGVTLDGGTLSMAGGAIASGTVGGHGKVVYDGGSGQISLGGTNNFSSFTVSGGTLETQNGFHINSSGGITVNSGGTLIAGGAVTVQSSGTLTVSGGGTFSATNISTESGGEISMSGGVLQAAQDIAIHQALTNAYGDVCAGGTLTVGAGATQPGSGEQLNLSAGKNINADGQVVSATNISAGGAIAAGNITAASVIADGSISASANISADAISAGDTVSAGGNLTAGTLALSAVPASGATVSAVGDVNVTDLNVSDFNPAQNTNGSLISAGGTVSAKTVNGKSLTAGSTVDTNVKQAQPKAGIDTTFDSLSVSLAADQKTLTYDAHNTYKDIAFSTVPWNTGSAYYEAAASDRFNDNTSISAEKLRFTFAEESQKASLASGSTMTLFANATGLPAGMTVNYGSGKTSVAQSIEYKAPNGAALTGTLTGTAATTAEAGVGAVKYTAGSMTLDSVDLAGWDGTASSTVPDGWTAKNGTAVTVYTDNMKHLPTDIPAGGSKAILTAAAGNFFLDNSISGGNKYGTNPDRLFTETDTLQNAVVIKGAQDKGVKAADTGKSLVYAVGIKDVTAVSLGAVAWQKDAVLLDGSDKAYNYSAVASLDDGGFDVAFEDGVPETVAAGDSMTLLKANETLQDMAAVEKQKQYKVTRQSGDLAMYTVDAILTGNLTANSGRVAFTAAVNQATKLTFENVNWLDSGALIDHKTTLANVSFNGAVVDTSKINFINKQGLEANQQMTLVSDFGGKPGKISGT